MQPEKEHKRKYAVAVGGIFMVLAIIGAINIIALCISLTINLLDNQKQKTEIENFLTPIVMFDPAPFSDASEIDNTRILMYSMWTALSDESQAFKRSEENFTLLVPAGTIEVAAHSIFKDKVKVKHETFRDIESTYYYNDDEKVKAYEVNTAGFLYVYRPQVNKITKNDDGTYDIEVEYISPENAWVTIFKGDIATNSKIMTYVLEREEGKWFLLGIRQQGDEGFYQGGEITGTTETARGEDEAAQAPEVAEVAGVEEPPVATPDLAVEGETPSGEGAETENPEEITETDGVIAETDGEAITETELPESATEDIEETN